MRLVWQYLGATALFVYTLVAVWQARYAEPPHASAQTSHPQTLPNSPRNANPEPAAPRDLPVIVQSGELRVLVPSGTEGASVSAAEKDLVLKFAAANRLKPVWVTPQSGADPDWKLQTGEADLAVSELVPELQDRDELRYTLAWGVSRQQVVGRSDTGQISEEQQLLTRQVALKRSSPVWERLSGLDQSFRTFGLVEIPEQTGAREILKRLQSGRYDLAVLDSSLVEKHLTQFLDLQVKYDLTQGVPQAWATHADSSELLDALNGYLQKRHLELGLRKVYRGDLPDLRKRNILRLITYQGPASYFVERGRLKGFDYELVKRFAQENRMRLDVVIARDHEELGRLLLQGHGDLVAAGVPAQGMAGDASELSYSDVYNRSAPVIVGRGFDEVLLGPRQLDGRRVIVPPESPFRPALEALLGQGIDVEIVSAPPEIGTEQILFRVASGLEDLTVLGSHQVKAELARQWNLKGYFSLTEPQPLAWVMRRADTQLQTAVDEFLAREYRRGFYNAIYSRYLERPMARPGSPSLLADVERLSPYDDIVHRYADQYDFDWRLIVAQMYQESLFDPQAISIAGATGLMQVLPTTGQIVGITDLHDPQSGILAGVRYLDYLRDQFEDELLLEDRTWFTLAAYNAGPNRIQRARRLAKAMQLDDDRWFGNVEMAMMKLAEPYVKDGTEVRDCRCRQTVVYVRDIRTRYRNYVQLTQAARATAAALAESRPGYGAL